MSAERPGKRVCVLISEKVLNTGGRASCVSDLVVLPPKAAKITVSAWIKARNIVAGSFRPWDKLRLVVTAYDREGNKIRHWDIAARDGSFDWTRFSGTVFLPTRTASVNIGVYLTRCTGTAWIDDVSIRIEQNAVDLPRVIREIEESHNSPALIPYPWKVVYGEGIVPLRAGTVYIANPDDGIEAQVYRFLARRKIKRGASFHLLIGHPSDTRVGKALDEMANQVDWDALGKEGYVLRITRNKNRTVIVIASNGVRGRLYGFQTLRQLAGGALPRGGPLGTATHKRVLYPSRAGNRAAKVPNTPYLPSVPLVDIVDRPTLRLRGIAVGANYFRDMNLLFERLVFLKCNYLHLHGGSILGHKLNRKFREPFSAGDIKKLKKFLDLARQYHFLVSVSVSPCGVRGSDETPPIQYCSATDFALLCRKLETLHRISFSILGLNFDDWHRLGQHVLVYPDDVKRYGNIGKAHYALCRRVYDFIKELDPGNRMIVCPLWYYGVENMDSKQKMYLRELGNLPRDVSIVTTVTGRDGVGEYGRLVRRAPLIWDNEYAHWRHVKPIPPALPALERPRNYRAPGIEGYIFLPASPREEDNALVGWCSTADYMWAPERYDPKRALHNAVKLNYK